jgi:hypothetical protein
MSETREEVLSRNAFRFAKSYYDNFASKGVSMLPAERKAFEKGEDAYVDWVAGAMYAKMSADPEYSADNWDDAKAERLDKYKDADGALILADEVLTPDSSRFWPQESYAVGKNPPSLDKQFVRDWLDEIGFNRRPPAPELPDEVVRKTHEIYVKAYEELSGKKLV